MVMPAAGGEPKVLVPEGLFADDMPLFVTPSFAWTAESRHIVFTGKGESSFTNLYQVAVSGGRPFPLPFNSPGVGAGHLAASAKGDRLVYTIPTHRSTIWRYDLQNGRELAAPQAIARSPQSQTSPDIAPDGRRFAFASNRSGVWQIYTAARDGNNPMQLTSFENGMAGWPRWSPDGKHIAFDARPSGSAQVFVVDAEGGTPQPLTQGAGNAVMPAWSTDGAWIYYTLLDANGGADIWKVSVAGGASTQVTSMNAYGGFPAQDGAALYVSNRSQSAFYWVSLAGGKSLKLAGLDEVRPGRVAVARTGLYYITRASGKRAFRQLMYYSFAKKISQPLLLLTGPASAPAIAVSQDENEFLLAQDEGTMSQLMLVEHFR